MKPPKSEPYQRSRHRAALHAWVVAATAVASVGMPSAAVALPRDEASHTQDQQDLTPSQAAQRVAADWLAALQVGDIGAAAGMMLLPKEPINERDVMDETVALSDWLSQSGVVPEAVAHRHAGHWALSAWRLDEPGQAGLLEPITLYHPVADALAEHADAWRVVPQGFADDPALAPLINADHAALMDWSGTLA